jgi:geranylgeranyl pyrophosphate synthase
MGNATPPNDPAKELADLLAPLAVLTEQGLDYWLLEPGVPPELGDAMRYCALNGGKRLRPALVLLTAQALGDDVQDELLHRASVALELVHSYSLVHDDLPGMDNDVLRRGVPTAHVQFGEAMAILVGDALLTRAFALLAELDDPRSPRLIMELGHAAGGSGMIAGQAADMDLCVLPEGLEGLEYVHRNKTGALIRAAVRMGAISAGADDATLEALSEYGMLVGLAFQGVDDLLDATGDAATLGKTPGKDTRDGRPSLASLLGVDGAAQAVREMSAAANAAIEPLGEAGQTLRRLANLLAERTY